MAKLFANSGDPDQTPRFAASDLGPLCLPITLLQASRLQWVNAKVVEFKYSKAFFRKISIPAYPLLRVFLPPKVVMYP